jgi:hypothetical protein
MDRRGLKVNKNREAMRIFGPKRKLQNTGEKHTMNVFMIFTFHQTLSLLSDREG